MPEETFETPQTAQPTEQKSTDWTKIILAAVLGFVLLASSASAGYYYGTREISNLKNQISNLQLKPQNQVTPTPTPEPTIPPVTDPTAGWEVYRDETYNYELKYPKGWFVSPEGMGAVSFSSVESPEVQQKTLSTIGIVSLTVVPLKTSVKTIDGWVQYLRDQEEITDVLPEESFEVLSKSTFNNQFPSVKLVYEQPRASSGPIEWVYILKEDTVYGLGFYYNDEDNRDAFSSVFDQILSTFRFLD